jgi:uncharacterized membrane protein YfcA
MLLNLCSQRRRSSLWLLLIVVLLLLHVSVVSAGKKCSTGSLYSCPNCGGIEVEDCFDCDGYLSTDTQHDICFNRVLFQPKNTNPDDPDNHYHYLWNDLVGAVVWFFTAGIAMACGVGGGGIYVPLGILLFQFAPKQASGLSQASIFGASLGGLLLNSRAHHPNKKIRPDPGVLDEEGRRTVQVTLTKQQEKDYEESDGTYYQRPLIHYDMALFLAPMEMAGAVLGVLIQKLLPNWLYLLIAGLVLMFTSYKTYKKWLATHKKEKALREAATAEQEEEDRAVNETTKSAMADVEGVLNLPVVELSDENGLVSHTEVVGEHPTSEVSSAVVVESATEQSETADVVSKNLAKGANIDVEQPTEEPDDDTSALELRKQYLEVDSRQYPTEKIVALIVLWIGLLVLTLMKGGKGVDSIVGITCESPVYGVLIACQFVWMFGFALYFGHKLVAKQGERVAVQYPYLEDDPIWDRSSLRFYGSFTFVAGIVAGLIGIGGGMVLGPLMLVMGIHPRVSSATTATMIVLTSSSVAVIFVTSGLVPWTYAVFYFFVCFFGALFGKRQIDKIVKRTGRASILIFILATIIALATIGCLVILLLRLSEKGWCFDGFNSFCSVSDDAACSARRLLQLLMTESSTQTKLA